MQRRWIALAIALTFSGMTQANEPTKTPAPAAQAAGDDENLWLDDIDGAKPLAWVKDENAKTVAKYAASQDFKTLDGRILEMLDSDAKIPMVSKIGLAVLVVGCAVTFIGFQEFRLARAASDAPEEISLQALIARGADGNANIEGAA